MKRRSAAPFASTLDRRFPAQLLSFAKYSDVVRLLGDLSESFASFAVKGFESQRSQRKADKVAKESASPDSFVCCRMVTAFCVAQSIAPA